MATSPALMRSDSVAENMPEALRERRYLMKKCFGRFVEQGRRLMKLYHIMNELEKCIDDHTERHQVLQGILGYILSTTQVQTCSSHMKYLRLLTYLNLLVISLSFCRFPFLYETPHSLCFCQSDTTQEAAVVPPYVALAVRPNPGVWEFVKVNANDLTVDGINATEYLKLKETIYDEKWYFLMLDLVVILSQHPIYSDQYMPLEHCRAKDENALEVDFGALDYSTPHLTMSSSVGHGMNFISKILSSNLWDEKEAAKPLVEHLERKGSQVSLFLSIHSRYHCNELSRFHHH